MKKDVFDETAISFIYASQVFRIVLRISYQRHQPKSFELRQPRLRYLDKILMERDIEQRSRNNSSCDQPFWIMREHNTYICTYMIMQIERIIEIEQIDCCVTYRTA